MGFGIGDMDNANFITPERPDNENIKNKSNNENNNNNERRKNVISI